MKNQGNKGRYDNGAFTTTEVTYSANSQENTAGYHYPLTDTENKALEYAAVLSKTADNAPTNRTMKDEIIESSSLTATLNRYRHREDAQVRKPSTSMCRTAANVQAAAEAAAAAMTSTIIGGSHGHIGRADRHGCP